LSGRPPLVIPQSSTPIDAAVSGDGDRLAVVGGGKTVSVWNMSNGRLIRTFRPVTSSARPRQYRPTPIPLRVAITGSGDVVASGDSDGTVCLWNVATGKLIAADTLSGYAVVELNSAASGSAFLAVDWPDVVSGVLPPGTGHVLDPSTGKVLASFKYPETPEPVINPGAALSADGGFLLAGVTGLAPAPPGGFEATYQVSTGQPMTNLQSVVQSGNVAYSESPVRPWAPDGDEVLAGTAIYPCDACGTTDTVLAAAASRIAWSQPLSASNDHPPATNPYR
jgi:WD40 repeat protein